MKLLFRIFFCLTLISSAFSLTCKVEKHFGSPTLFINDKPTVPFIFYGDAEKINSNSNFINQVKLAKKNGIHIYSFHVPMIWKTKGKRTYSTLYKIGTKKESYARLDKVIDGVLKLDPDALIIPRFYLHPPIWWLDENPEVKMQFSDGKRSRISVASEKWRDYVKTSLKEFIRHCENKYGNHIIGYHPTILNTGECFYERTWEAVYSGFEKPLKKGFAKWIRDKYLTIDNLRTAWKDNQITFDKINLPTVKQRANSADGYFRDSVNDKFVIDFYEYKNFLVVDTIEFFADIIKKETSRKKICITFYGYTFELAAIPHGIQLSGHLSLKELLKSKNIDVICAPISYSNRRPGGIGAFMAPVDSIRAAGKLWINEDDTRTYLCADPERYLFGDIKTVQDNLWVYNRHFAHIFPRRMGTWYMDLFGKGWLNSADLWNHIAKLKNIYESQLNVTSSWKPEVSVVIDERSPLFLACNNPLANPLYSGFRSQLYRMGTPFNLYLLSDVLDGTVKLSKVNIFLGAWYLKKAERASLISTLKNKTAVWFYGAGYMDETGASKKNISKLTGFSFEEIHNKNPQIKFIKNNTWNYNLNGKTFKPPLFGGMDITDVFQTFKQNIPNGYKNQWAIEKKDHITPLAVFDDGTVGLAAAKHAGFESVYCGITGLPAQFLRNVIKNAGIHIYVDSDDTVEADEHFLSIGVYDKKTETINLPEGKYLYNILEKETLLPVRNVIKDDFKSGETKLYWIKNNGQRTKNKKQSIKTHL